MKVAHSVDVEQPVPRAPVFFVHSPRGEFQRPSNFSIFPTGPQGRCSYTGFTHRVTDASNPPQCGLFQPQGITSRRASFTGRHFRGHP